MIIVYQFILVSDRFLLLALLCALFAVIAYGKTPNDDTGLVIIDHGASDYRIVLGEQASPSEQYAAEELQLHLAKMTGVTLPIVTEREPATGKEIVLGWHERAKQAHLTLDTQTIGSSGFMIVPHEQTLYIMGSPERGTLYGVYSLLEDDLGCRWYAPDVTVIPTRTQVALQLTPRSECPPFMIRNVPYQEFMEHPEWAARNRLSNTWSTKMQAKYGGEPPWAGNFCHTFNLLVPPNVYFATHPEYFAMVGGKRDARGQLCLHNPQLLALVIEKVRELLQKNPGKTLVSVSQNDCAGYCECPDCKALDEQEGSPSASIITFVNKVADALGAEFPKVMFHTFAYSYSRKPPKTIVPHANVLVEFCTIECSFSQPLKTGDNANNRALCEDMAGWQRLGAKLAVWDYVIDFFNYQMPFPNYDVLASNVRYFAGSGVVSVNEQANYQSAGGELSLLRGWVLAKLLWNPQRDEKALFHDFITGYYQEAAPPVFRYLDYLSTIAQAHPNCGIFGAVNGLFDVNSAATADQFWAEAESLAQTPEIKRRVELSRLSTRYIRLVLTPPPYANARFTLLDKRYQQVTPREMTPEAADNMRAFFDVAAREGVTKYWESVSGTLEELKNKMGPAGYTVETVHNKQLQASIIPELGGRLLSLRYLPRDMELLYQAEPADENYPNTGGYEENLCGDYRDYGSFIGHAYPLKVPQEKQFSLEIGRPFAQGALISRAYSVSPADEAALTIQSRITAFKSPDVEPRSRYQFQFHSRAQFHFGDWEKLLIYVDYPNKSALYRAAALTQNALGGLQFGTPGIPAPNLILYAPELKIGVSIDCQHAEHVVLHADGKRQYIECELLSPGKALPQDSTDALALQQSWTVIEELPVMLANLRVPGNQPPATKVRFEEDRFRFSHPTTANYVVPAAGAGNGYAAVLDFTNGWESNLQCRVDSLLPGQAYTAIIYLKLLNPDPSQKMAARVDIWDEAQHKYLVDPINVTTDQLSPTGWTAIKIGNFTATPGQSIRVFTPAKPTGTTQLLVDRIECEMLVKN